jgi:hypothetical protein
MPLFGRKSASQPSRIVPTSKSYDNWNQVGTTSQKKTAETSHFQGMSQTLASIATPWF